MKLKPQLDESLIMFALFHILKFACDSLSMLQMPDLKTQQQLNVDSQLICQ